MLILLPPSETKGIGTNSAKMNLASLSFPELSANRALLIQNLINLSKSPTKAMKVLGISKKQILEVEHNSQLTSALTSPAINIYSGVLFEAFDYLNLPKLAQNRANRSVVITSSLFGLLGLQDPIPHYRLSGNTSLPKFGSIAKSWVKPIDAAISKESPELIIDMRSGVYAKFWQAPQNLQLKTVTIKIMSRIGKGKSAKKIAISHSNKLSKGLLTKDLVQLSKAPRNPEQLTSYLESLNWNCELSRAEGKPFMLEVFV